MIGKAQVVSQAKPLPSAGAGLARGLAFGYVSVMILLPLAAISFASMRGGFESFWTAATDPAAIAALQLTFMSAAGVSLINAVLGTLFAWVLVRDDFPGKGIINALVDLPFAIPTIVAGVTLIVLYGPNGPVGAPLESLGIKLTYSSLGVFLALMFVTFPFVVRAVQPVLIEWETDTEEAASMLGANGFQIFWRVVFPNLLPAILTGVALAFARAIGEFGSVVLISGNIPFKTQVASVYIFSEIENYNPQGATAVSVVLLALSFAVLVGIKLLERIGGHHNV